LKVKVRVFGRLAEVLGREFEVELEPDARVKDLLAKLRKIEQKIGENSLIPYFKDDPQFIILVNGFNIQTLKKLNTELRNGDTIILFPPVEGG
jgi:molybdopterin synthase sulfur carrier subunit